MIRLLRMWQGRVVMAPEGGDNPGGGGNPAASNNNDLSGQIKALQAEIDRLKAGNNPNPNPNPQPSDIDKVRKDLQDKADKEAAAFHLGTLQTPQL